MEIIQERLEREFNMTVITTVPNVSYFSYSKKGEKLLVNNPSDLPDPSVIEKVEEPTYLHRLLQNLNTLALSSLYVLKKEVSLKIRFIFLQTA